MTLKLSVCLVLPGFRYDMGLGGETENGYFPFGLSGENTTKSFSFSSRPGGMKRGKNTTNLTRRGNPNALSRFSVHVVW